MKSSFSFLSLVSFASLLVFDCIDSTSASTCSANDLTALNYALTLEHLESAFYTQFQNQFNSGDFINAGFASSVYPNFALIQAHEAAHVAALTQVISSLGGTPVPACVYNFTSISDVKSYVKVAAVLENTGVSAYDGAINTISDAGLQQTAATIATIEARHAAFLNELNNQVAFPDTFDSAIPPNGIVSDVLATGFIKSCPYQLAGPVVLFPNVNYTVGASPPLAGTTPIVPTPAQTANDIKTLNYALTLEHLESTFYNQFTQVFTAQSFTDAGYTQDDYQNFFLIAAHESAHVSALTTTINSLGGTPVPVCVYNFSSVTTMPIYIATAKLLESTGVSAYDGAVNTLTETGLSQVAATIATVEARHATYLNQLAGAPIFNMSFDTALTPTQVVQAVIATGIIVSCPYDLVHSLPSVLAESRCYSNSSAAALTNGAVSTGNNGTGSIGDNGANSTGANGSAGNGTASGSNGGNSNTNTNSNGNTSTRNGADPSSSTASFLALTFIAVSAVVVQCL